MELLIPRGAGMDVHQATVVVTVRTPGDHGERGSGRSDGAIGALGAEPR